MESSFALIKEDATVIMRTWRSALVFVWRSVPDAVLLPLQLAAVQRVLAASGKTWVLCNVIPEGIGVPDGKARDILGKQIRLLDPHLTAAITVVLGRGFQAAATRAVLSGLALFARQKHPAAFVASIEEAARHAVKHWPPDAARPSEGEIAAMLREAIAR